MPWLMTLKVYILDRQYRNAVKKECIKKKISDFHLGTAKCFLHFFWILISSSFGTWKKKGNLKTSSWALRTEMGIFHRLLTKSVILSPRGAPKARAGWHIQKTQNMELKTLALPKTEDGDHLRTGDTVVHVVPTSDRLPPAVWQHACEACSVFAFLCDPAMNWRPARWAPG